MRKSRYKDLLIVGKKIGKLTVLEKFTLPKKRGYFCKCICSCGKYTTVSLYELIRKKHSKSCGCNRRGQRKNIKDVCINILYASFKATAKHRKIDYHLNKDDITNLVFKPCYYCESPPKQKKYVHNLDKNYILYNGLDRVDNNIGYIKDNVVTCCWTCNSMKAGLSCVDFYRHISKIYSKINEKTAIDNYKNEKKENWSNIKIED